MFERYTEKARRVIFFSRYEASQFFSPVIDTEHLLLGLLREDSRVARMLPYGATESIRAQLSARTPEGSKISINVDLPLSNAAKRVLAYGAEEAVRLNHRHIGSEHLLLGLLREKDCLAAEILQPFGIRLEQARKKFENSSEASGSAVPRYYRSSARGRTVVIHNSPFDLDKVRDAVQQCRDRNWHWRKVSCKPRDCVVERQSGKVSLELSLAEDTTNFELVKGGWKKDHCSVCGWELYESGDDHGVAYTNGRDWVCIECYEKFWDRPNFISGSYSDIT